MDPVLKAKWVAALRSGKYEQARGGLERDGKFCCLGVLCKVLDAAYPKMALFLPEPVVEQTGLKEPQQSLLADRNDGFGKFIGGQYSFAEIADYIEQNL